MSLKEIFLSVSGFLEKEHADYAVIVAFALYGYGYVRATKDIDFILRLSDKKKTVRFLENIGFETIHASESFSNHLHPIGASRVDMMYVNGATADVIFSSTVKTLILNDISVPVVSVEHLIALKLFAAWNNPDRLFKELSDIQEVLKVTRMNPATVKKYFLKYGMEKYYHELIRG